MREFPKIRGPNLSTPNSRALMIRTPHKKDPMFMETAILTVAPACEASEAPSL